MPIPLSLSRSCIMVHPFPILLPFVFGSKNTQRSIVSFWTATCGTMLRDFDALDSQRPLWQDLAEVELPLIGAAVAQGPLNSFELTSIGPRGKLWRDHAHTDSYINTSLHHFDLVWCWQCYVCHGIINQRTGEASQAHKIEQLAHLAKLLQMQQQMDVKMEKMLTLGNLCPRRRKYMQVCARRSGYNRL